MERGDARIPATVMQLSAGEQLMRPGVERDVWMEQRQGGTMEGYGKRVLIADDEESVRQLAAAATSADAP